jgi:Predicted AAA-ATPase
MEKLPNLPIGRQYFADIRRDNALYVDKTAYIYQICRPASSGYFLSRPRRFGKSLVLDTINELFSGNRALFEGLWIADKWDWSETYPVIRMSLDNISHEQGLKQALFKELNRIARTFDVTLEEDTGIGSAFRELIEAVVKKTGKQVVILIDEYDRPIVDYTNKGDLEKGNANRETLRYFFAPVKNASNHIRFLFITSVSAFAEVGIFVELNHLLNITDSPKFAPLCDIAY